MALPLWASWLANLRGTKGDTGTITDAEVVMIPAGAEPSVVMSGPESARKATFFIPRGLPGVNAVPADAAVADYATGSGTATNTALRSFLLPRGEVDGAVADHAADTESDLYAALIGFLLRTSEVPATVAGLIESAGIVRDALFDAFVRFSKPIEHPVAVTIGSSNAEPSRGYVQTLCDRNGLINKNFAVGGGGFNQPGALSFASQITAAIADTSFPKNDVTHVFIIDVGNDTRGKSSIFTAAAAAFLTLTETYPNATVYVVPSVMTLAAPNTADREVLRWVSRHFNELRNASQGVDRVQVIPYTGLWFWDSGTWVEADGFNVHLNTAGYDRLLWGIEQYMNGRMVEPNDLPDSTGDMSVTGEVHSRRVSGLAYSYGTFTLGADQTTSIPISRVPKGFEPLDRQPVTVVRMSDGVSRQFELATDGFLNLQVATPAGTYRWVSTYGVM